MPYNTQDVGTYLEIGQVDSEARRPHRHIHNTLILKEKRIAPWDSAFVWVIGP